MIYYSSGLISFSIILQGTLSIPKSFKAINLLYPAITEYLFFSSLITDNGFNKPTVFIESANVYILVLSSSYIVSKSFLTLFLETVKLLISINSIYIDFKFFFRGFLFIFQRKILVTDLCLIFLNIKYCFMFFIYGIIHVLKIFWFN